MAGYLGIEASDEKPYIFISYNTEDQERLCNIMQMLQKHPINIWYDNGIKRISDDGWKKQIALHIRDAEIVFFLISRGIFMKENSFVRKEYNLAKTHRKKICIVLLDKIDARSIPADYDFWWEEVVRKQCIEAVKMTYEQIAEAIYAECCGIGAVTVLNTSDVLGDCNENIGWEKVDSISKIQLQKYTKAYTIEEPVASLCRKLRNRLVEERDTHASFKLMNDVRGLDPNLIPKGSLLIPVSSRWAELDGDWKSESEAGEDTEGSGAPGGRTLADYIRESRTSGRQKHVTIEGEGGIGKTVALLSLATDPELFPEDLPVIYVPLHRLNQMKFDPEKGKGRLDWFIGSCLKDKCGCTDGETDMFHELCRQAGEGWPRVVLLLDGYNEVLEGLKRQVRTEINEWADQPGVQIITTSRTAWSCGEEFMMIRLRPLERDNIQGYLERMDAEIPAQGDNLWRVINYPLMLTLYTHISAVRRQYGKGLSTGSRDGSLDMRGVLWRPMNKAGDIIWNYLQKELVRCADELDVRMGDSVMEDCAVAILHTAPYIAWRMSREDAFSIPYDAEDETMEGQLSFTCLIRESISCLRERENWPDQLKRIIKETRRRRWERLGRDTGSDEFLDKEERIEQLLLNEISLFRIREDAGNDGDTSEESSVVVELMHQQFRDGLAAVWLCQRIESMEKPAIMEQGSFRSTGDKYALPRCWRERIGRYVLEFVADIMNETEASLLWEAGRIYQPSNIEFAYTLLDFARNRSYCDGVYQNDFTKLDFSGMDLRRINLFSYKAVNNMKLKLPGKQDLGKAANTKFSLSTFEPPGHNGPVVSLAISGDEKVAISGGRDGYIHLIELENMRSLTFLSNEERIESLATNIDGSRVVAIGESGALKLWDLNLNSWEEWSYDPYLNKVIGGRFYCVSISSDGKTGVCGEIGKIVVFDFDCFTEKEIPIPSNSITTVSISDNNRVICGADDGGLYLIDLMDDSVNELKSSVTVELLNSKLEKKKYKKNVKGHIGRVRSISISKDGTRAVSGGEDRTLKVWNLVQLELEKSFNNISKCVRSVSLSSDGMTAVAGGTDQTVRIFNLENMHEEEPIIIDNGEIRCVTVGYGGNLVLCSGDSGDIELFNRDRNISKKLEGYKNLINTVSISGNGYYVACGGSDNAIRIWDISESNAFTCKHVLYGHTKEVRSVSLNSDAKVCISGSTDETVLIFDLDKNKKQELYESWGSVNSVSLRSDGLIGISGGYNGKIYVFNTCNRKPIKEIVDHIGVINSVCISSSGEYLVSAGSDAKIRGYSIKNLPNKEIEITDNRDEIFSIKISEKKQYIVSSGKDEDIHLYTFPEMKTYVYESESNSSWIRCLSISENGIIMSGFDDGRVQLIDAENVNHIFCKKSWHSHFGGVLSVSIDSLANHGISTGRDGCILVYDFNKMTIKPLIPLFGIDVIGIDLTEADIDFEWTREILRQNGALV